MVYAEYGLPVMNHGLMVEASRMQTWSIGQRKSVSPMVILEEEIRALRDLMERSYREHQSFTAEFVLEISRTLDAKINEYMRLASQRL